MHAACVLTPDCVQGSAVHAVDPLVHGMRRKKKEKLSRCMEPLTHTRQLRSCGTHCIAGAPYAPIMHKDYSIMMCQLMCRLPHAGGWHRAPRWRGLGGAAAGQVILWCRQDCKLHTLCCAAAPG